MIGDVVNADVLLHTDNLRVKMFVSMFLEDLAAMLALTHLHIVACGVQLDPPNDTRPSLVIAGLDHAVDSWILQGLG